MSYINQNKEIKGKKLIIINDNSIHNNPKENDYSESLENNQSHRNFIIIDNSQNNNIINTSIHSIKRDEESE